MVKLHKIKCFIIVGCILIASCATTPKIDPCAHLNGIKQAQCNLLGFEPSDYTSRNMGRYSTPDDETNARIFQLEQKVQTLEKK